MLRGIDNILQNILGYCHIQIECGKYPGTLRGIDNILQNILGYSHIQIECGKNLGTLRGMLSIAHNTISLNVGNIWKYFVPQNIVMNLNDVMYDEASTTMIENWTSHDLVIYGYWKLCVCWFLD